MLLDLNTVSAENTSTVSFVAPLQQPFSSCQPIPQSQPANKPMSWISFREQYQFPPWNLIFFMSELLPCCITIQFSCRRCDPNRPVLFPQSGEAKFALNNDQIVRFSWGPNPLPIKQNTLVLPQLSLLHRTSPFYAHKLGTRLHLDSTNPANGRYYYHLLLQNSRIA